MTSPSTLTLGAVKNSSIRDIAGVCVGSPQFVRQLNEGTDRLMNYGDWWATTVKARLCFLRSCVAYPRWVGTVLAMNLGGFTRPIQGKWFDFMPISSSDCLNRAGWQSNVTAVDDGLTPVFENIPCGVNLALRTFTRFQKDIGKTVTYYGIDQNGQEVMTRDVNGNWSAGETIALTIPYTDTATLFREVTRVSKDMTQGPLDVYAVDAANNVLLDVAHYDPSETEPMYRHTSLRGGTVLGFNCGPIAGSCCPSGKARTLDILAKLQFIPVVQDTDTVQIDCISALKFIIQALRLEEAGDDAGAASKQGMAIRELNRQLRNKLPLDQIPIDVSSCGTALPSLHGIGQMM